MEISKAMLVGSYSEPGVGKNPLPASFGITVSAIAGRQLRRGEHGARKEGSAKKSVSLQIGCACPKWRDATSMPQP